ncbi:amidohydrolase [Megasphaera cerevisiae DSM 20462]|jgi:amidohydrolase|uniref:Peptidase M20 domain-containing protein 2 n=1 Tax=Megasphaera cerevisiae DSM 20462 TaxID=1122219 RepID=A0A0J6WR60_9FIRM|nr:amidohydrolase [Megasphaera cerevisiae]KMO85945.1 amidohydrolase [Megasphaera cerevisiae DSM 20462]MCI1750039.1 amidohydrolase [Megasphaera cerevisiae]OKY53622.1 amidohydrolase [Megasphaera cerevisiae]SJZ98777.1 amidohydrolase [Megasphaera cerevisiae DSM 20462]
MNKEELKLQVCAAVEKRAREMVEFGQSVFDEPELGYKELKTSEKVQKKLDELQIPYQTGMALTGVKGRLKGASSRRTVAVLGELDAIICRRHPAADTATGAAHCCGHYVQLADMLGVAMALQDTGAMQYLGGDVVFFAVPAEECIELEYRNELREHRKIHFLSGKQELIYRGEFDDIDAALQMHVATTDDPQGTIEIGGSLNGFISKIIDYHGKAAHAAGAPHLGVNALNAAMLGMMGVNALRETFREEDYVRFHPIITQGGDLVNVVPDFVRMESYVRAASAEAMKSYNDRIDRALKAGADAIGATCEIHNMPGDLPLHQDTGLSALLEANSRGIFGGQHIIHPPQNAGSTDMGDVSHLMPVLHPHIGCVHGALHSADYELVDPRTAFVKATQVMVLTLIDLLYDDASGLETVLSDFKPPMTKEGYLDFMDSIH